MRFKRVLSTILAAVLSAGAVCLPATAQSVRETAVVREYTSAVNSLPAPSPILPSGSYAVSEGFNLPFSTLSGDEIWYSLNGTGFRRYTEPLKLTQNSTIRVFAMRGAKISPVVSYTYNLIPIVSISHAQGTYIGAQRVFINSGTEGVKIYYTLDGSTPNERSALYSASSGILIGNTSTLKIIAVKTGWYRRENTYNYTIIGGMSAADDPYSEGGLIGIDPSKENTANTGSILNKYTGKWGYNQLNAAQKSVYEKLFDAAKTYASRVDISALKIRADDFDKAFWAFDYDNPQFLTLGSGYSYYYYPSTGYLQSFTIKYGRTDSEIRAIQQTFDTTVKRVVDAAKTQFSDYSKLKYIHDWIVNNTDYTLTGPAYKSEADGAVVYGKALCEGYSKAFMYMAQELGFECICVVGNANNSAHMWNMVKLDGSWYHVDVTFDDPIMSNGSKVLSHDYFLLSTYQIRSTHTINNPISVPTATRSY